MARIDNPAEWILLLFNKEIKAGTQHPCLAFDEGVRPPNLQLEPEERIHGVYREKYFFSPIALYVVEAQRLRRVPWKSIVKCSSYYGCDKKVSRLTLNNGRVETILLSELGVGRVGRINQLYHQMIERHGSLETNAPVPEHLARFSQTLTDRNASSDPLVWRGEIRCVCGSGGGFKFEFTGEIDGRKRIGSTASNPLQSWLACSECGHEIKLFDPSKHGYDASTGESVKFRHDNTADRRQYLCGCGGTEFRIYPAAVFDFDCVADMPAGAPSNEFGYFSVTAQCCACGRKHEAIDYETA